MNGIVAAIYSSLFLRLRILRPSMDGDEASKKRQPKPPGGNPALPRAGRMSLLKKIKGVVLTELLVVIVVLGILALSSFLVAPTYLKRARDARRKADLERIKVAFYDYYFDRNCFPKSLPECDQDFVGTGLAYLNNFPCDPKEKISYSYQVQDGECGQWFKILAKLENTKDTDIDKVGCRTGCGPSCQYNYGLASTNIKVTQGCVVYFACGPNGECGSFDDPGLSQCPRVFENDSTCGGGCDCSGGAKKENCCHDESGKHKPGEGPEPTITPTEAPTPTKAKGKK